MVQIVNYLRAKMLHSSNAAFSLAIKNNTYLSFAEKIISAKSERTHCDLIKTHSDLTKTILTNNKTLKYESFLENLSKIKSQHHKKHELEHKLLDYSKLLSQTEFDQIERKQARICPSVQQSTKRYNY